MKHGSESVITDSGTLLDAWMVPGMLIMVKSSDWSNMSTLTQRARGVKVDHSGHIAPNGPKVFRMVDIRVLFDQ